MGLGSAFFFYIAVRSLTSGCATTKRHLYCLVTDPTMYWINVVVMFFVGIVLAIGCVLSLRYPKLWVWAGSESKQRQYAFVIALFLILLAIGAWVGQTNS